MAKTAGHLARLPRHESRVAYPETVVYRQDLRVHALGIHEEMPPSIIYRPGGSGDYLMMGFHGPAMVEVAGQDRQIPPDSMVVWDPAMTHRYGNATAKWSHTWFHCSGSLVVDQMILAGVTPGVPFDCPVAEFTAQVRDVHREIRDHVPSDRAIVRAHVGLMFRHIARAIHGIHGGKDVPPELLIVRRHMEEHLAQRLRLADLARLTGWSVPHFCAQFKRHFSLSAIDFLIDLRLHHARLLLTDRNLRVDDVAQRVGYSDYRQFSKLFRKCFGHPPRSTSRS